MDFGSFQAKFGQHRCRVLTRVSGMPESLFLQNLSVPGADASAKVCCETLCFVSPIASVGRSDFFCSDIQLACKVNFGLAT